MAGNVLDWLAIVVYQIHDNTKSAYTHTHVVLNGIIFAAYAFIQIECKNVA